jgi:hypothetical protein
LLGASASVANFDEITRGGALHHNVLATPKSEGVVVEINGFTHGKHWSSGKGKF